MDFYILILTFPIERYEIWTYSQTVMKWCSSKTLELRVFERNRVDVILKQTNGKVLRFVPTDQNPADVATRGFRVNHTEKWDLVFFAVLRRLTKLIYSQSRR